MGTDRAIYVIDILNTHGSHANRIQEYLRGLAPGGLMFEISSLSEESDRISTNDPRILEPSLLSVVSRYLKTYADKYGIDMVHGYPHFDGVVENPTFEGPNARALATAHEFQSGIERTRGAAILLSATYGADFVLSVLPSATQRTFVIVSPEALIALLPVLEALEQHDKS